MRMSDLELYKWKLHNDVYTKMQSTNSFKQSMPLYMFWRDFGAFVSIAPRLSGKTTMLANLSKYFKLSGKNHILIVNSINDLQYMCGHFKISRDNVYLPEPNSMHGINYNNTNLMIDEFMCIDKKILNRILDNNWESVTLVSSLVL